MKWEKRECCKREGHGSDGTTYFVNGQELTSVLIACCHNLVRYIFCFRSMQAQKDGKYSRLYL